MSEHRSARAARARARIAALENRVRAAETEAGSNRRAVAMRDALIAAIGRELSNQVAPVSLAIERLRGLAAARDAARIEAGLDLAERACAAFSRRSLSLLEFAELAGRAVPPSLQEVDLSARLGAAAMAHEDVARRAGCVLRLSVPAGIMALGIPSGVDQVLDQLLANAFKFGAGRPVELSLSCNTDAQATVSVRDEGPGISPDTAAHLFDLNEDLRPRSAPGLGIGLWLAAQWAQAMGGALRLANQGAPGACFELALKLLPQGAGC